MSACKNHIIFRITENCNLAKIPPILVIFTLFFGFSISAQTVDTVFVVEETIYVENQKTDSTHSMVVIQPKHSAHKATIYSLVLPGLGQAYNKKYWKIPIIYIGFGALTYFAIQNNGYYKDYRNAYLWVQTEGASGVDNQYTKYNSDQLYSTMNFYQSNRDLSYILMVLLYTINIVDAAVDAHLYDFDVNDELSLKLAPPEIKRPEIMPPTTPTVAALTLTFKF